MRGTAPGAAIRSSAPIADGSGHDRQTLVVGSGPAALATAGFLDQAGLNPVLAPGTEGPDPTAVVLWEPGLVLLERLGLRRPVETVGAALTDLACTAPVRTWTGSVTGRSPLVAVRRDHLAAVMYDHLADRFRTTDRPVESVRSTGAGVRVTFVDGVAEPFDVVATSRRPLAPGHDAAAPAAGIHWWTFEWPRAVQPPEVATEAWGRECAAFAVPVGGAVRVDCLATGGPAPVSPVALDALREQFGPLSEPLGAALAALDRSALQYGQLPRGIPGTLCADGVASVGRAAHARLPGGCLGPALSIEDGWVLADALAYGPAPLDEALASYADRRRRRLVDVSSALRQESLAARIPGDLPCPFRQLCARRTVAFGHLFDAAEELVRDVSDRL